MTVIGMSTDNTAHQQRLALSRVSVLVAASVLHAGIVSADSATYVVETDAIEELCLRLAEGQSLHYVFEASGPVKFNLHYHAGGAVHYPVPDHETRGEEADFRPEHGEVYCLMWTGTDTGATTVTVDHSISESR